MPKLYKGMIREKFNRVCIAREKGKCRLCSDAKNTFAGPYDLEVHHITNRKLMPNGGYVKENGIALCPGHHLKVEKYPDFYTPEFLYKLIGSSYEQALDASERLC